MLKLMGPLASIPGLCYGKPTLAVLNRIKTILPKNESEWSLWVDCVTNNQLSSIVLNTIYRYQIPLPNEIETTLQEHSQRQRLRSRQQLRPLLELFKILKGSNIPFILLGPHSYIEDLFNDTEPLFETPIKLLFRPQDLYQVSSIYSQMGLVCLAEPKTQSWVRKLSPSHWPLYMFLDRSLLIQTYWVTQDSKAFSRIADWGYWNRAEKIEFHHMEILRLSVEDFVHSICLEVPARTVSLISIFTLLNATQNWTEIQWNQFRKLIQSSSTEDSVFRALSYGQALYFDTKVQAFIQELAPKVPQALRRRMHFISEHPPRIMKANPSFLFQIEMETQNIFFSPHFATKIKALYRIVVLSLFPPVRDLAHVTMRRAPQDILDTLDLRLSNLTFVSKCLIDKKGWKQFLLDIFLVLRNLAKSSLFNQSPNDLLEKY